MKESTLIRHLRRIPVWLVPLLAAAATALLWMRDTPLTRFTDRPQFWLGVVMTAILWLLVVVNVAMGLRQRRLTRQLDTVLTRRSLEAATLEPADARSPPQLLRYVPSWLVLVLGLVTTGAVWLYESTGFAYTAQPELWLGVAVSAVVWLLVLANGFNRVVARTATAAARAARRREALTLEMLQSLDVMISAVAPDGSRSRFNSCYRDFTRRTEDQLERRGWLACLNPDDREPCLGTIVNHDARPGVHLELEYTMIGSAGEPRWIREFLVPRFGADGTLLEYVASATDITPYVENETEHEQAVEELRKQTEKLRQENAELAKERAEAADRAADAERRVKKAAKDVDAASSKLNQTVAELKALKSERTQLRNEKTRQTKTIDQINRQTIGMEKAHARAEEQLVSTRKELGQVSGELKSAIKERETAKAETERASTIAAQLERSVENLEAGEKTLRSELEQARDDLNAQPDLQAAQEERDTALAELKNAADHATELEKTVAVLRASESELKDQLERDRNQREKEKGETIDVRRTASQHRTKINRLTARCQELEKELKAVSTEREALAGRASAAEESAASAHRADVNNKGGTGGRELDAELSTELRLGLSSVARINEQLCDSALDEMQRNFIENAQASVDAMVSLIDGALGVTDASKNQSDTPNIRAFDLSAAARGVCDLIQPAAEERGLQLRCTVAPNVPPLVSSDPVRLRKVLMYLLNAAIRLVEEGEVTLRIGAEGITNTHGTMRFEISHPSARVGADRVESTFALSGDAKSARDDPVRQQAARAWQLISEMKGQFGFDLPEAGGFKVWFSVTLPKLAAGNYLPGEETPARALREVEAPSVPLAATAPVGDSRENTSSLPSEGSSAGTGVRERKAPRLPQELLDSNLGSILELGADSARVEMNRVPKGSVELKLHTDDDSITLPCNVVSHERIGDRKVSVVLRFTDITGEQRQRIMQIVLTHRKGVTLLPLESGEDDGG